MASIKKGLLALLFVFAVLAPTIAPAINAEITWSPDTQLTTDLGTDWNPGATQVVQDTTGTLWVVWASNRLGNYDIFYKTSSDGGSTWSTDTQLTTDTSTDDVPSITQMADETIWVVWESWRSGNPDLWYKTYDGISWSAANQLTNDTNFDLNPRITQMDDGTIWVVWQSDRVWVWDPEAGEDIPQDDIFYKTSSDGGSTWSTDTQLTTDPRDDVTPSITQLANGTIFIVWSSFRWELVQENNDLTYKTSSDGGTSWSADTRLTTDVGRDWSPSTTQIAGTIWVVWHSKRGGNYDIYYKTYDGAWSADTRLTNHTSADVVPSITQTSDGKIWIVWASGRTGNYDLWYKKSVSVASQPVGGIWIPVDKLALLAPWIRTGLTVLFALIIIIVFTKYRKKKNARA